MSSLWKLPIIYVCENNQYTEYTPFKETVAGEILARAEAFNLHTLALDGQDVREIYLNTLQLVERVRIKTEPSFMLCNTYRHYGHHVGDINRSYYRSKKEEKEWKTMRDPIQRFATWLLKEKLTTKKHLEQLKFDTESSIQEAVQFALDASYPETSEVNEHVYA